MTRDDIIRMAREAGLETHERKGEIRIGSAVFTGADSTAAVERFAALVAAAERGACAQECDAEASVEGIAQRIAAAIRARGQA